MSDELKGIGGWLILVAIGLVLTPFVMGMELFNTYIPLFLDGSWQVVIDPTNPDYHALWAPLLILETVGNAVMFAAYLYILVLFFKKSRKFPKMFIIVSIAFLIFMIVDFYLGELIPAIAAADDSSTFTPIAQKTGATLIWIPYMLKSRRVKNTFVR